MKFATLTLGLVILLITAPQPLKSMGRKPEKEPIPDTTAEDREIIENLELLENLPLLEDYEILEEMEILESSKYLSDDK